MDTPQKRAAVRSESGNRGPSVEQQGCPVLFILMDAEPAGDLDLGLVRV
jgi:hypothetical protein